MKKGISIFGKQYEIAYKNDVQADGSVVKDLFEQMIKLDESSVEYLYGSYTDLSNRYEPGSRIFLENIVYDLIGETDSKTVDNIISYCRNIVENCDTDTEDMIFGGTEEEIVERGTYWCTDIARVACAIFQIAGFPARIVITANTKFAYCGHSVTEVYYNGKWGVADPTSGVVIRHQDETPASAWEIQKDFAIANRAFYRQSPESEAESYFMFAPGEQYESVGISNYYIDEKEKYSYATSKVNDYCRAILKNSDELWASGLRWIHGEDLIE
ncbi:MAG: transglutaminase domain-containing protein [Oscillospiraceae bacterium]|nr:transglutaminase domain-containing protein [Oscillospiraceae bacterium]